jgi:hypothetical protein
MKLASVALARVCHNGRRPQFVGLQGSYRAGACQCSGENISGEMDRADYGRSRCCYGSWSGGGMSEKCSSLLVSHIHGSCESGPGKVGVENVHHEPVKDKHDAANIDVRHNGCVNDEPERGFNLALDGRYI